MILRSAIIFLNFFLLIQGQKLHELLTKREIKSIFGNKLDGKEYEISHVTLKRHGHSDGKRFKRLTVGTTAYGYDISLELEETDHVLFGSSTPIHIATTGVGKINYQTFSWPDTDDTRYYHNKRKRAAITVHTEADKRVHINGVYENYEFRSLPSHAHEILKKYYQSNSTNHGCNSSLDSVHGLNAIIRHERQASNYYDYYNYHLTSPPSPTYAAETVYPEILVVVDHETYKYQKNDIYSVARYVAALYNAFDLRFRQMTSPKIRLNIAGLVIAKDPTAVPFAQYGTKVHESSADYMSQYLSTDYNFYQSSKVHYDLVHVLLHRPVIHNNGSDMGGVTKMNVTCLTQYGLSLAVSISTGSYVTSSMGVHELAHAFGAPHDGPESADVPGGPCSWSDGFVMSYEHSDNGKSMFFSPCSITAMQRFLLSPEASCVLNKPNVGKPGKKTLPGKLLTRDQQCSISLGTGWISDKTRETNCRVLWCAQAPRPSITYTPWAPPAEGSYCYPQYICLNGNCVPDPTKKASG